MRALLLGFPLFLLIALWRATLRIRLVGREHRDAIERAGRPVLHAIWHQRMVAGIFRFPHRGYVTMASRSKDGDVIAGFLFWWGFRVVRGSSSRGGGEALAEMVEALKGTTRGAALTPDGPRGPARRCKTGILRLAEAVDAPIMPVGASSTRPRFLRSWDRYLVPMPFSRCAVVFGEGLRRAEGESDAVFLARVDAAIDAMTDEADRLCGVVSAPREREPRPAEAATEERAKEKVKVEA
ncbi:MAG: lysophospholipid acyltransferase family protein [Thermoanaerobaculia bacterium]